MTAPLLPHRNFGVGAREVGTEDVVARTCWSCGWAIEPHILKPTRSYMADPPKAIVHPTALPQQSNGNHVKHRPLRRLKSPHPE